MKKFSMFLSILAMIAFLTVPAMADKGSKGDRNNDTFEITGSADQASGGTIFSGDVTIRNNGNVTVGGEDKNAAFLSGGNTSEASFKDTAKDPFGIAVAAGITYGIVDSDYDRGLWNGSYAAGITAGGSLAYKDCRDQGKRDFTEIAGEGSINHATYTTGGFGSYAYTSGSAAYKYAGETSGDFIAGGGIAATGGYSGIAINGTQASLLAVSGSVAVTGVTTGCISLY